jgi:hypothetical protein
MGAGGSLCQLAEVVGCLLDEIYKLCISSTKTKTYTNWMEN